MCVGLCEQEAGDALATLVRPNDAFADLGTMTAIRPPIIFTRAKSPCALRSARLTAAHD
jgi:hypothetical protein